MHLKLNFTNETRNLYLYVYKCQNCGRSDKGLELHHILGRISNSKLNAIVLCLECHSHCCHSREEESKYLKISIRFHLLEKNELVFEDIEFYKTNKRLYE